MVVPWTIREETSNDVEAIDHVTVSAFDQAPHADGNEHLIVRRLREANVLSVSLVAESNGEILGHVAVSPVTLSDGTSGWFGLGPVSVDPAHQGVGIGSALIQEALARIQAKGGAGCVVLGEPAYYGRFGFKAETGLTLSGFPPQYFQALSWGQAVPAAEVAYHRAFGV